jgi:Fe-S oxidoreductase
MEERIGKRISQERTEEILAAKAGVVATACPYCLQMFEVGIKALEAQEKLKAIDLAELVAQSLGITKK